MNLCWRLGISEFFFFFFFFFSFFLLVFQNQSAAGNVIQKEVGLSTGTALVSIKDIANKMVNFNASLKAVSSSYPSTKSTLK